MEKIVRFVIKDENNNIIKATPKFADALVTAKENNAPSIIQATWDSKEAFLSKASPIDEIVVVKRNGRIA